MWRGDKGEYPGGRKNLIFHSKEGEGAFYPWGENYIPFLGEKNGGHSTVSRNRDYISSLGERRGTFYYCGENYIPSLGERKGAILSLGIEIIILPQGQRRGGHSIPGKRNIFRH